MQICHAWCKCTKKNRFLKKALQIRFDYCQNISQGGAWYMVPSSGTKSSLFLQKQMQFITSIIMLREKEAFQEERFCPRQNLQFHGGL